MNNFENPKQEIKTYKVKPLHKLLDPIPLSEYELKSLTENPRKNAKQLTEINENIEKQFNQMWFHLYKTMSDTETRRIDDRSPEKLAAREALTQYAKKASLIIAEKSANEANNNDYINNKFLSVHMQMKQKQDEEFMNDQLKHNETKKRVVDKKLEKIVFLGNLEEEKIKIKKNIYDLDNATRPPPSKYKRWVLRNEVFHENDDCLSDRISSHMGLSENSQITTPAILSKQTSKITQNLENLTTDAVTEPEKIKIVKQNTFKIHNLDRAKTLLKSESKTLINSQFDFGLDINSVNNNIPNEEILSQLVTPIKKHETIKFPNYEKTPLTRHAQSVMHFIPKENPETKKHNEIYNKTFKAYASQIYGKKPFRCVNLVSDHDKSLIAKIKLKSKTKMRFFSPPQKPILSNLDISNTTNKSNSHDYFFLTNNSNNKKPLGLSTFNTQTTKCETTNDNKSKILSNVLTPRPAEKIFNNLWENCTYEQLRADKDIGILRNTGKNFNKKLRRMNARLRNPEEDEEKINAKKFIKSIKKNKHLFIYGKNGNGRFMSTDGKDVVRLFDQISKMSPKYDFLNDRLDKMLEKELANNQEY